MTEIATQCPTCGCSLDVMERAGIIVTHCPVCYERREREMRKQAEDRELRSREHWFALSGIPAACHRCRFENYSVELPEQRAALATCHVFASAGVHADLHPGPCGRLWLCLLGRPGTGKSHLAAAVAWEMSTCHTIRRTTFRNMAVRAWGSENRSAEIRRWTRPGLLIVDEIPTAGVPDYEYGPFHEVLNSRYEELRPTILISNTGPAAFRAMLRESLSDRLNEVGEIVPFTWESWRERA